MPTSVNENGTDVGYYHLAAYSDNIFMVKHGTERLNKRLLIDNGVSICREKIRTEGCINSHITGICPAAVFLVNNNQSEHLIGKPVF